MKVPPVLSVPSRSWPVPPDRSSAAFAGMEGGTPCGLRPRPERDGARHALTGTSKKDLPPSRDVVSPPP